MHGLGGLGAEGLAFWVFGVGFVVVGVFFPTHIQV